MELIQTLLGITLFGFKFWGLAVLIVLVALCFWADYEESGFVATLFCVIAGLLFYFWGNDTWKLFVSLLTFYNISVYLGAGLFHALTRVFFHGRKEMKRVNEDRLEGRTYEHTINRDIKNSFFRWWFLWPVSFINWIIKDMVKEIYDWFYSKIQRILNFILDLGVKSVKEVPKKPEIKTVKIR